ncbi:hypothetical protein P280DRAFT_410992, partial [Massarina eburnea CBS 473.64]
SDVTDKDGLCNGLRDNMHHFGQCKETGLSCDIVDGKFEWKTVVPVRCNNGMIESAWWEATKNEFGPIECGDDHE